MSENMMKGPCRPGKCMRAQMHIQTFAGRIAAEIHAFTEQPTIGARTEEMAILLHAPIVDVSFDVFEVAPKSYSTKVNEKKFKRRKFRRAGRH